MSGDVVIEVLEQDTVVETIEVSGPVVLEVPAPTASPLLELLVEGPQGAPGDTRVHIGNTPPSDTSMVWIRTT